MPWCMAAVVCIQLKNTVSTQIFSSHFAFISKIRGVFFPLVLLQDTDLALQPAVCEPLA